MKKKASIINSIKSHATLAGTIGTVGGFIADVLSPLADFALYIFLIGLLVSGFSGFKWFKKRKPEIIESLEGGKVTEDEANELFISDKISRVFSFSSITTLIMFFIILGQLFISDDEKGMFASTIPGLDKLQEQLLNLEEGINEIKQTTKEIKQDTADIKGTTKDIKQDTSKILDGVTAVSSKIDGFNEEIEEIKGLAGLIAEPKSFPEYSHNAKIHIEQENYQKAHEIYEKLAQLGHDYFDIFSDHEFVCKKMGMSYTEVENYFNEYQSKNGRRFGELRLAVELTHEKLQSVRPDPGKDGNRFMNFIIKDINSEELLEDIRNFCDKYPTDIVGRLYYLHFARTSVRSCTALYDGWTFLNSFEKQFYSNIEVQQKEFVNSKFKVWKNLLTLCEDVLQIEFDFKLQFDDSKSLKRRFFWNDYGFGGSQIREMEIVPDIGATDFKDCVQKRYGNSTSFRNWNSFFCIFGNGEGWDQYEDYGPDRQSYGSGPARLKWSEVPRSSRFKSEYVQRLVNADVKLVSVVPDFSYNKLLTWNRYFGIDKELVPYSEWAFYSGREKIDILQSLSLELLKMQKAGKNDKVE
jgi:tetratricopeptide (TPR) repeat protein